MYVALTNKIFAQPLQKMLLGIDFKLRREDQPKFCSNSKKKQLPTSNFIS